MIRNGAWANTGNQALARAPVRSVCRRQTMTSGTSHREKQPAIIWFVETEIAIFAAVPLRISHRWTSYLGVSFSSGLR
jgi:hypothetical protein